MKHYFKKISIVLLSLIFIVFLFLKPEISQQSIIESFLLWQNKLVPSLFPMIIVNDILVNYNFSVFITLFFKKIFYKLFKLSQNGTYILLMSLFIGTPANAILMKQMIQKDLVSKEEANKILYFCYFSNPLFLFNILKFLDFSNIVIFKIIFFHYISNFITAFIIRKKYIPNNTTKISNSKSSPLLVLMPNSLKKSFDTMIIILGIICFYNLIINYLPNITIIKGLLEITSGLNSLQNVNNKLFYTILFINFGGISIFTQIKSILEDTNLNFINFLYGRIISIILNLLLLI